MPSGCLHSTAFSFLRQRLTKKHKLQIIKNIYLSTSCSCQKAHRIFTSPQWWRANLITEVSLLHLQIMARIWRFFSQLFIAPITHHDVIEKCSLQMESTGSFCIQFSKINYLYTNKDNWKYKKATLFGRKLLTASFLLRIDKIIQIDILT